MSRWSDDDANPWKMRFNFARKPRGGLDPEFLRWTIYNDRSWWAAVWEDLVVEHGKDESLKFWRKFAAPEAIRKRGEALAGVARFNWSAVESVFQQGKRPRKPSPSTILIFERFAARTGDGERLAIETAERFLGRWLWDAIHEGEYGEIRKLADLVSGKKPPESPDLSGTEKFKILDAFALLLPEHFRLPSKVELFERATATRKGGAKNFPKYLKELGLIGLPGKMPKVK
jgi:hypothetical protein